MRKCKVCKSKVSEKNNGLFLQEMGIILSGSENEKIGDILKNKEALCIDCKKDLMFAMII